MFLFLRNLNIIFDTNFITTVSYEKLVRRAAGNHEKGTIKHIKENMYETFILHKTNADYKRKQTDKILYTTDAAVVCSHAGGLLHRLAVLFIRNNRHSVIPNNTRLRHLCTQNGPRELCRRVFGGRREYAYDLAISIVGIIVNYSFGTNAMMCFWITALLLAVAELIPNHKKR